MPPTLDPPPDLHAIANGLVAILEAYSIDSDRCTRGEHLLSAAAATC